MSTPNQDEARDVLTGIAAAGGVTLLIWKLREPASWVGRVIKRCLLFFPLALAGPFRLAEVAEQVRSNTEKLATIEANQGQMKDGLAEVRSVQLAEMEVSKFGIWFSDVSGKCISVNQTLCRMAGRGESEFLGWEWMNIIHDDDKDRVTRTWVDAVRFGHAFRENYRLTTPDGGSVAVKVIAAMRKHPDTHETMGFLGRAELA